MVVFVKMTQIFILQLPLVFGQEEFIGTVITFTPTE